MSDTLHGKVQWSSSLTGTIVDSEVPYGIRPSTGGEWRIVVEFTAPDFGGMLLEDADGAFLCWNDFVANDWTEQFSSTAVALARLALLMDAAPRDGWFENGPLEFHKSAHEFFEREAPTAVQVATM